MKAHTGEKPSFKSCVSSSVHFQMSDLIKSFMRLGDRKGPILERSNLHVTHVTRHLRKIEN